MQHVITLNAFYFYKVKHIKPLKCCALPKGGRILCASPLLVLSLLINFSHSSHILTKSKKKTDQPTMPSQSINAI